MVKYLLVPIAWAFTAASDAACVVDNMELGDTGPSSAKVCESLERRYPDSSLAVLDRNIDSAEAVSIRVAVDGISRSLRYRLVGADWVLDSPQVAGTHQ